MMTRLKYILILLLFTASINAQYTGLSISGGIGTYKLNDLKLFQDEIIAVAPVSGKGFTYFPPFTHVRLEVFRNNPYGLKYGISYSYSTTGAHANYKDYSGTMNIDQNITAYQLGASVYFPLVFRKYFEILPYGRLIIGYTRNQVSRNINTYYRYQNYDVLMRSIGPAAEVGFEAIYHLSRYSFALDAGYQYDVGGFLNYAEKYDQTAELILPDRPVRSDMTGIRLLVKFVLRFNADQYFE